MVDMGCIRRMSMNDNCVEPLANHDVEIGVSRKSVGIRIQVSDTEKEELLVSNTSEISPE